MLHAGYCSASCQSEDWKVSLFVVIILIFPYLDLVPQIVLWKGISYSRSIFTPAFIIVMPLWLCSITHCRFYNFTGQSKFFMLRLIILLYYQGLILQFKVSHVFFMVRLPPLKIFLFSIMHPLMSTTYINTFPPSLAASLVKDSRLNSCCPIMNQQGRCKRTTEA